ncbi:hypothetical protein MVEN_01845600 [Mycena venus]|uniref:Uncharacterized protein n=1 Tax=Mycena venus TaxID=2733690 RepID=A0A8H6XI65_9AGAR|nr:hypothetical protein MVEN_01845600 [Mycena venus]
MSRARVVDPSRSINVSSPLLLIQLNQLLLSLNIPITIKSHTELVPSLLIAILESLLSTPLPISEEHRKASSAAAKEHCMKIFLGVMQADILKQDVGISNVDPRRLARGADEETIFVARLLCWYGRRRGLISRSNPGAEGRRIEDVSGSPSTLTSATRRTVTETIASPVHMESDTSVSSDAESSSEEEAPHAGGPASPVHGSRCIHEVPSPSLVLSPASNIGALELELDTSLFALGARPGEDVESRLFAQVQTSKHKSNNTTTGSSSTSVRYEGYISLFNEEAEIAAFEARRIKGKGKRAQAQMTASGSGAINMTRDAYAPRPASSGRKLRSLSTRIPRGAGAGTLAPDGAAAPKGRYIGGTRPASYQRVRLRASSCDYDAEGINGRLYMRTLTSVKEGRWSFSSRPMPGSTKPSILATGRGGNASIPSFKVKVLNGRACGSSGRWRGDPRSRGYAWAALHVPICWCPNAAADAFGTPTTPGRGRRHPERKGAPPHVHARTRCSSSLEYRLCTGSCKRRAMYERSKRVGIHRANPKEVAGTRALHAGSPIIPGRASRTSTASDFDSRFPWKYIDGLAPARTLSVRSACLAPSCLWRTARFATT